MKLENQVCSLDQAKRLKELGVNRQSIFNWNCQKDYGFGGVMEDSEYWNISFQQPKLLTHLVYSAFTVAELGEMIPDDYYLPTNKGDAGWWISGRGNFESSLGKTEAQARAAMLIHLLEQKIITSE